MKNAFEVNLSTEEQNYKKFIVREVSDELKRKSEESDNTLATIQKNANLPFWFLIVSAICGFAGILLLALFFDKAINENFTAAYRTLGWMIYVGGACLVFSVAVFLYNHFKVNKTLNTPAVQSTLSDRQKLIINCYENLGTPQNAEDIDIFVKLLKIKNGKVKRAFPTEFTNVQYKIFKDGENLYLNDISCVCAFPLNKFTSTVKVNKKATFSCWNKQEKYYKGIYRQYKVRCKDGTLFIKTYYSVRFTAFNEEYEIVIPNYELQTFLKYVNLSVM